MNDPATLRCGSVSEGSDAQRLSRHGLLAALVLGGILSLFFLYHATATILFPYDLDWGEGYVLNDALRLSRGEAIYVDIQQYPMVRSPYPPIFPALNALLLAFTGPSFVAGRFLSVAATLASAALGVVLARISGASRQAAVLAGLAMLACPYTYQWAPYSRVDMLAIALSVLALVLASGQAGSARLALAGLAACAALFTKQTSIAAPLAIAVAILVRQPRLLVPYLAGLLIPASTFGIALITDSDGQFIRHVVTGNAGNPANLTRLARFQLEFTLLHPLLVLGALALALRETRARRAGALALGALFAWLGSFSVANETSSVNYFLEFVAFGAPAAAVALTRLMQRETNVAVLGGSLALLQLAMVTHVPNVLGVWPSFFPPHGFTPSAGDAYVGQELDAYVRSSRGDVLAEPAGFAIRNGRQVLLQPLDLRAEQLRGRWSSDELRRDVRARRFALIILSHQLLPEDVLEDVKRFYALERTLDSPNGVSYSVWRPSKPDAVIRQTAPDTPAFGTL